MMKKIYFIACAFIMTCLFDGAYAASTLRKAGDASVSPNIAARSGSLRATSGGHAVNINKPVVKTSATGTERVSNVNSRLSAGKFVGANKTSVSSNTVTNELSNRLDTMDENVQTLQEQSANVITNVVETEQGRYVTGVSADGNQLNVTKTSLLYAPVREGNSESVTGEAEIWLVR